MNAKEKCFISLNDEMNPELMIEQLENRKETDPLLIGNPLDAMLQLNAASNECHLTLCFNCGEF